MLAARAIVALAFRAVSASIRGIIIGADEAEHREEAEQDQEEDGGFAGAAALVVRMMANFGRLVHDGPFHFTGPVPNWLTPQGD